MGTTPNTEPPDEFWRTLVANRGHLLSFLEPVRKPRVPPIGGFREVNIEKLLIQYARHPRDGRVLAKNIRSSLETGVSYVQRMALSDWHQQIPKKYDRLCILYGCSVPVILRHARKTEKDLREEYVERGIREARQR
jgi:hypothetical protein